MNPALSPGDGVRLAMTKWSDRPHWTMSGRYLGTDAQGDWVTFPAGTAMTRPGRAITSPNDQVALVPAAGHALGPAWLATFHAPGGEVWTYVDMTSVPVWDGATIRAVDLDLDVVEALDHTVYVDDEDEFAAHRVEFAYPADLVTLALGTRDAVHEAVRRRRPPFDGSAATWFDVLARVTRR